MELIQRPKHGGNLAWATTIAGCPASSILDFSASINPLGPPSSALVAIQSHLGELKAYPDPNYQELRESLCRIHPHLGPEWILPGNGSAELLTWAAWDLAKLPKTYLVTPAFNDYWRALRTFDANVVECPLFGNWGLGIGHWSPINDPEIPHNQLGLLLNNPHNPTGLLFSREMILPYLEKFALVVVDEAFMDFLLPEEQQSLELLIPAWENLVILRSITKFYSLPGLRLGYAMAHPDRLNRWQSQRDPWPINCLAVAAAIAVCQDTNFQQETRNWLVTARTQLFNELQNLPGLKPFPGQANFLLVHSAYPVDKLQISLLQNHRILIRDCLSFPELGNSYFRVAVRTPLENQVLIDALTEIIPGYLP